MNVKELYETNYNEYISNCCADTKYEWVASNVFDMATYDGSLDELFVKKIVEVCKVILNNLTYEYIGACNDNYIIYILVCQLLYNFNWINWGTSIRGAWFEEDYRDGRCRSKPILTYYDDSIRDYKTVPFTVDNLVSLIEFIEEE